MCFLTYSMKCDLHPYFPYYNANAVHTCIWELLQFSFVSCVLQGRVVSLTSSIQIVKTAPRKQAASTLPFCAFSTSPSFLLPFFANGSSELSALPAWASPVREHFLAWGSNHVGKMGSASWSSSHNSEIRGNKTWAGKSLASSKHWVTTGGGHM